MPVHIKIRELLIRFEILQPHKEAVRKMICLEEATLS